MCKSANVHYEFIDFDFTQLVTTFMLWNQQVEKVSINQSISAIPRMILTFNCQQATFVTSARHNLTVNHH